MDKTDYSQLELFSQDQKPLTSHQAMPSSMRAYVKNYEKAVLVLIAVLVVAVAAFSLGVERGKRMSQAIAPVQRMPVSVPAMPQQQAAKPAAVQPAVMARTTAQPQVQQPVRQQAAASAQKAAFTIQIASFSERSYAAREADSLKKRGYQTNLIPRGKYIILCVGAYPDKNTAQTQLAKLQKQYQGCFIRRL